MKTIVRRIALVGAALTLLGLLAFAPAALASNSGQVTVSGAIVDLDPIELTLCDTDAAFGTNLDANGTASNSTDTIAAIPGSAAQNQGAAYQWSPACPAGQTTLLRVDAPHAWTGSVCATENSGASSVSVAGNDLRFSHIRWSDNFNPFNGVISANTPPFTACASGTADWTAIGCNSNCGVPGITNRHYYFYLKIDRDDTAGTFASTTTWTVISG